MKCISINKSLVFATVVTMTLTLSAVSPQGLSVAAAATPNQQPVAFSSTVTLQQNSIGCATGAGCGQFGSGNSYFVPQGKMLVIQQLMATEQSFSSAVQRSSAFLVIDQNPATALPIPLTQQDNHSSSGSGGGNGTAYDFAGSQQVTIYLNAGQRVDFAGTRAAGDQTAQFNFLFYGYLLDAP